MRNDAPLDGSFCVTAQRLGIDSGDAAVLYLDTRHAACTMAGFSAGARVQISAQGRSTTARLNLVDGGILAPGAAGLSELAWRRLGAPAGCELRVQPAPPARSFSLVRSKIYGQDLSVDAASAIVGEIAAGLYSEIEIAAFVTACASRRLEVDEVFALTGAMVEAGTRLEWPVTPVVDKHCVGGLPGNRTTPLVVSIVAACGLTIPKTSSRAITSPAGTADVMETLAPVALDTAQMRRVVEQEGGCIVWGGAVDLSPADDILIRVSRPLDFDGEATMVASVLSKKIAAGATHVLIDIPVGPSAKVRSLADAESLTRLFLAVGGAYGLHVRTVISDGRQPVGRGIGPALEALDALAVLRNDADAPQDLRGRALALAGQLLELGGKADAGAGLAMASATLASGAAWRKFQAICAAQGGMRAPQAGACRFEVLAARSGRVATVDNRQLARVAKLAGAPRDPGAGVLFRAPLERIVSTGEVLYTIVAQSSAALARAIAHASAHPDIVGIVEA
ncbi:thymidine phosphorylase family protein [Massilia sp. X63]|uniref:thymidine phosphorylase family protein n=1 Tax=Massilia sp. X63 TaxID=3237285 RepID=UPI0034DD484E